MAEAPNEARRRPLTSAGGGRRIAVENGNQLCYHPSMEKLKHTTGCVYQTAYHIVWCPVYRRDVLKEPVKNTPENVLHTIAHQTCSDRLWAPSYYVWTDG